MEDAAQILVIILSVFLAFFLLLAIVLIIMLIRVTRQIQAVAKAAEHAAENMGGVFTSLSKAAGPAVISKLVIGQIKRMMRDKQSKRKERRKE